MYALATYRSILGASIRAENLRNLPLHHIRAQFCGFWIKFKYSGNATQRFCGKIGYFTNWKSTQIIFRYIHLLIWGLSSKDNPILPHFALSVIILPQKHLKKKRKHCKCRQRDRHKSQQRHNIVQKGEDRHVFLLPRWQSPQARVAVDCVQAPDDLISTSPPDLPSHKQHNSILTIVVVGYVW